MPIYRVYHCHPALAESVSTATATKRAIASGLVGTHLGVSPSVQPTAVKVWFLGMAPEDCFVGRDPATSYVRVHGQVRAGKTQEERDQLLHGMFAAVRDALGGQQWEIGEIQTQVSEIDDTQCVMTNGKFNE